MYFNMPCWQCGKPLRCSDENIGKRARCPYCGAVGEIQPPQPVAAPEHRPAPPEAPAAAERGETPPSSPPAPGRAEGGQGRGTGVSLPLTALIALVATGAFFAGVIYPLPDNIIRRLFLERHWVPYVIVFLTFWAAVMLIAKYRKLRTQRSALLFDALPTEVAEDIRPANVEAFRSNLLSLPIPPDKSFLVGRVLRALEHYKVHPSQEGVATVLATQSEIESNIVETSYTMIKVLIWAIPILGFIGTVMGVGEAVGSFSAVITAAEDFTAVKDSLGKVTTGLGVAFDTTLLALVMSLLVMFPASAMQKAEEDLLAAVDQYCNENVLRRLYSSHPSREGGEGAAGAAGAVDEALARHTREMDEWVQKMEAMSRRVTSDVADAWTRVRESFERAHREQVEQSTDAGGKMVEAADRTATQLAEAAKEVSELARMHDRLADVHRRMLDRAESLAGDGELKRTLEGVDRQVARTAEVLESLERRLSQSQAPAAEAQPLPRRKRRWWFFSSK